ncbi:chromosome segregation protein SMC [Kribbella jiaozuonensis]|uniref:Chromosome partition protein Smc n=1 Tax=Kribbella jiaozuonensis TaxID=2575441 RepID=A0A4U3LD09_9ACTN|nr:chromosome segregation protein SMC [Kribbella jiaozuonensis]
MTLRGFKSFASATTMNFEPGITCIVGPNGSGKSNVVDALAWVMGEQGAKSLRGGKMEDVIFAGTSGRAPLGRAEVVLTIDNTDGALPIEYAEVTISRTMFRNGGSDYQINGQNCRLLDVQELLSDSGIGREMHVIVGQGQLDSILRATPEGRRGFVEEAAGVLKHRKRKEKAIRKLEATEGNLHRLGDLIAEIRRQLKPLGRQAEVARRAVTIQAEVRDGRARLLADDIVQAQSALEAELRDEAALTERRSETEAKLREARELEAELEDALREDAPALQAAQDTWYQLSGFGEKIKGTARIAADRIRSLNDEADDGPRSGRDPEELELEAARVRETEAQIEAEVEAHSELLAESVERRQQLESQEAEEERRISALIRAAADRREGLARLTGQVNAMQSRAAAAESEIGRLASNMHEAEVRAAKAQHDFTALETQVAGLDAGEKGLDDQFEAAQAVLDEMDERLAKLRAEERDAERERTGLAARKEALELGLNRKDGAGALLAASEQVNGLMGSVAALLSVRAGYETAIAAALGEAADAVAVTHADAALQAVGHLKQHDLGRAGMLLGDAPADDYSMWPVLPYGASYAVDVVESPETLRPALRRLLRKVAVVDDVPAAQSLVRNLPDVTCTTRAGDVLGAHFAYGGSDAAPSLIEVQSAVDEASEKLLEATARSERLRFELQGLEDERARQKESVEITLARLHESDAAMAAVAEQLAHFGSLAKASRGEAQRMGEAIAAAEEERDKNLSGLAELEERLLDAEAFDDDGDEPDTSERDRLADAAKAGRATEMEARLALRTTEERARALSGRADSLERAARQEREARARAIARAARRARQADAAQAVHLAAGHVLARLESSLQQAAAERSAIQAQRADREQALSQARSATRNLSSELEQLTNTVHRDALARAEQKMRLEQLYEKALGELGIEVEALVTEYGPDQLVPPLPKDGDDGTLELEGEPFNRTKVEKRLKQAERALNQLGKINPLALEEFDAMEERHRFLSEQLDDLKKSRRDLMDIVKEVDERVEQVFTEAYRDVEVAFEHVFSRLFPGGEGRLVLTDPDDMLGTGIDVEARPPGKKVKRLSLLSGGERSLVAVAFLVALFKARPSPFYILDEVEAALDDTNLGRLLEIYEELRENSQLLVITHQKRTMEVADALYGVTMRGDGVSSVISQRIREPEPV